MAHITHRAANTNTSRCPYRLSPSSTLFSIALFFFNYCDKLSAGERLFCFSRSLSISLSHSLSLSPWPLHTSLLRTRLRLGSSRQALFKPVCSCTPHISAYLSTGVRGARGQGHQCYLAAPFSGAPRTERTSPLDDGLCPKSGGSQRAGSCCTRQLHGSHKAGSPRCVP